MAFSPGIDLKVYTKSANLANKNLALSQKSVNNISQIVLKRTKVRRDQLNELKILRDRRDEVDRRKLSEDQLEAPQIVTAPSGPAQLSQSNTSSGFFEKILSFLGYLTAGWLLRNLPTWIGLAKEFKKRLDRTTALCYGAISDIEDIFKGFGNLITTAGKNLLEFDFLDTNGDMEKAFSSLTSSFESFGDKVAEALGLVSTPLGQESPALGSTSSEPGAYVEPAPAGAPGGPASGSASNLAQTAAKMKGFSSAGGPDRGRNACVWAVNKVYAAAGIPTPWGSSNYVPDAEKMMIQKGYTEVSENQRQAGDIYIAYDNHPTTPQIHIGIVLANGNILSNSSSGAQFSWEEPPSGYLREYGRPGKFYRMPGQSAKPQEKKTKSSSTSTAETSKQLKENQSLQPKNQSDSSSVLASDQIAPMEKSQQDIPTAITPDRTPKDIMVYQPPSEQTVMYSSSGQEQSQTSSQPSEFDLLNNFMKNKLLLDLAYL